MAMKIKQLIILFGWMCTTPLLAQHEELEQNLAAFKEFVTDSFEVKSLNVTEPDWGALNDVEKDYHTYFELKAKEKREDNLGRRSYKRLDFALYAWEYEDDATWAIKSWLDEFMEGKKVRPGRVVRQYEYARPTIVVMDTGFIAILRMDCSDFFDDEYEGWVKTMEKFFNTDESMTLELYCDGPLEWTRNAPDPKRRRRRY